MIFTIYSDGGCSGNRRNSNCPGGYGYVILDPADSIIYQGGGKGYDTTNNRMEMTAVIEGVMKLIEILYMEYNSKASTHECIVKTDSKYVCENYTDYLPDWKRNGWRKSKGGAVLNRDLWQKIDELTPGFRSFRFQWVKGHAKDRWNNLADEIVQQNLAKAKPQPRT